ncbi:MAG: DMT family transporter [Paracoccaceae bacterium]
MSYSTSALIMLAAGIGVPVLAALNAHLGKFLGSPLLAVTTLLFVAFFTSLAALLSSSELAIASILTAPKYLFLAGLLMVFYILSITTIAPKFGIGNAVFFVLIGQLVSAAVIDHFAFFTATPTPLSAIRALGIGIMGLGVWITQQA